MAYHNMSADPRYVRCHTTNTSSVLTHLQKSAPNLYKASLANNQRRAPPLSLRPEMNKSSCSLPSRYSPGPNHYRTASGRARTPSSTVSWVSRPSERYLGSTDQSTRSASLTSIVEMYQRPLTASSTCPAIRPGRTLFYDYSEEFSTAGCDNISETAMPLSPVPHRAGGVGESVILRQDSEIKMHSALDNAIIPEATNFTYTGGYNHYDSSTDESFGSYLQGSHDDSIEEIERAIANAISTAAADKLMTATERLKDYPENCHYRQEAHSSEPKHGSSEGQLLSATERQYGIKPATGNFGISAATRCVSQASINRNAMALDPSLPTLRLCYHHLSAWQNLPFRDLVMKMILTKKPASAVVGYQPWKPWTKWRQWNGPTRRDIVGTSPQRKSTVQLSAWADPPLQSRCRRTRIR